MRHKSNIASAIAISLLIAGTAFLALMCAIPMVLRPELFRHQDYGISYFGTQTNTLLPYYAGFVVVVTCLAWAARLLWSTTGSWRFLRIIFALSAATAGAIAVTTYSQRPIVVGLHYAVCAVQLLVILIASVLILRQPRARGLDYAAAFLTAVDGIVIILAPSWQYWLGTYACREIVLFLLALLLLSRAAQRAVTDQAIALRRAAKSVAEDS